MSKNVIRARRVHNLKEFVEAKLDGNYTEAARLSGSKPSLFNDIVHGRKPFGETIARNIESTFKMEVLHLDRPEGSTALAPVWKDEKAVPPDTKEIDKRWTKLTLLWTMMDDTVKDYLMVQVRYLVDPKRKRSFKNFGTAAKRHTKRAPRSSRAASTVR